MIVYTYSEARQKLAALLEEAATSGEVKIRRRSGQIFVLRPETPAGSPLDIEGLNLKISAKDIVRYVREGRREPEAKALPRPAPAPAPEATAPAIPTPAPEETAPTGKGKWKS